MSDLRPSLAANMEYNARLSSGDSTRRASESVGSGVGTSFGTIPYSAIGGAPNPAGRMTEIRSMAQNSRVSMKITSKVGGSDVTGYLEGDFAGNNPSGLFVTSNSSTLRLRHYWAQLARGKFELFGGQAWTLMTPGRTGISPVSADPLRLRYFLPSGDC